MSCSVCDAKYIKNYCLQVTCHNCDYNACHKCYRKYLEVNKKLDACCMSCSVNFKDEVFFSQMPIKFKQENQKRLGDMVYATLEPNIPLLDEWVETEKCCRRMETDIKLQKQDIRTMRRELNTRIYDMNSDLYKVANLRRDIVKTLIGDKCCVASCNGLTNKDNICRRCNTELCIVCKNEKTTDHSCSAEEIESLKLIKETSVNCPSCAISISKIDGCDQMWCSSCHTKFHYGSGEIIHGHIHNPHLIEFDKTAVLNECEPIAKPPHEMFFPRQAVKPLDPNVYKYDRINSELYQKYNSVETFISKIKEFISPLQITRRRNGLIVGSIINTASLPYIKQCLVEDYREVEIKQKLVVVAETFLKMVCDILWFIAENNPKNYQLEKINNQHNDYRRAYYKYKEAHEWIRDEAFIIEGNRKTTYMTEYVRHNWNVEYQAHMLQADGWL